MRLSLLASFLLATCIPQPTPNPPPDPVPIIDAGPIEEQACLSAAQLCETDYGECLQQVERLRHAYYAELTDEELSCWVRATTKLELRACGNGVC